MNLDRLLLEDIAGIMQNAKLSFDDAKKIDNAINGVKDEETTPPKVSELDPNLNNTYSSKYNTNINSTKNPGSEKLDIKNVRLFDTMSPEEKNFRLAYISNLTFFLGCLEYKADSNSFSGWKNDPNAPKINDKIDQGIQLEELMRKNSGWTPGQPYCAAFAISVLKDTLNKALVKADTQTKTELSNFLSVLHPKTKIMADKAKAKNYLKTDPKQLATGDLILYSNTSDEGHTVIFHDFKQEFSLATCISGNSMVHILDETGKKEIKDQGGIVVNSYPTIVGQKSSKNSDKVCLGFLSVPSILFQNATQKIIA